MAERSSERRIDIRLTQDIHRRLRFRCAELDVTIQDDVVQVFDRALDVESEDDERKAQSEGTHGARAMTGIPPDYRGWWRIIDTGTWVNDYLDDLGPALFSLTGSDDRLRMHCLLAHVNARPTRTGVSFTWKGAWEYDQMSGTGSVKLGKNGRLKGKIRIKDGDESTFIAERAGEPDEPIPDPPSYRDKWRRGRW